MTKSLHAHACTHTHTRARTQRTHTRTHRVHAVTLALGCKRLNNRIISNARNIVCSLKCWTDCLWLLSQDFKWWLSLRQALQNKNWQWIEKWRRREWKGARHIGETFLLEQPELVWQIATVSKPMFVLFCLLGHYLRWPKNYGNEWEKHRSISYLTLLTVTCSKSKGKTEMWPVLHSLNAIGRITDDASSNPWLFGVLCSF